MSWTLIYNHPSLFMKAADNAMHTYLYTKPYAALPHFSIQSHHNDKLTTRSCIK